MGKRSHYASHLPVLRAAVARTRGAILEVGCGSGSTPYLHQVARDTGRLVISLETDERYFRYAMEAATPPCTTHQLLWLPNPLDWRVICAQPWDVVLVDSSAQTRPMVLGWVSHAQLVVVHDTEPAARRSYRGMHEQLAAVFTYAGEACPLALPWTRVVSNLVSDLSWVPLLSASDGASGT